MTIPPDPDRAFAEDCAKAIQDMYQLLADKHTGGDKEKLMERFGVATVALAGNARGTHTPLLSKRLAGCALIGCGDVCVLMLAGAVHSLAERYAKETGFSVERGVLKFTSEISEKASMILSEEEAKKLPIGEDEANAMRKAFDSLSIDDIKKLLGD